MAERYAVLHILDLEDTVLLHDGNTVRLGVAARDPLELRALGRAEGRRGRTQIALLTAPDVVQLLARLECVLGLLLHGGRWAEA